MPKTANNSVRCNCCQRLIARKRGKRRYCGHTCAKTDNVEGRLAYLRQISPPLPRWAPGGSPKASGEAGGHRALTSRRDFFSPQEFKSANEVFGQKSDFRAEAPNPAAAAVFGSTSAHAELIAGSGPNALPGLRLTVDLGSSWGPRRG